MAEAAKSETPSAIEVVVNGKAAITGAVSLFELVAEYAGLETKVATAVNGEFVPERMRRATLLKSGDKIEIVSPRQGG